MATLSAVLRSRLNLAQGGEVAKIKCRVLADETVRNALDASLESCGFDLLQGCLNILSAVDHPAKALYVEMVTRRFSVLLETPQGKYDEIGLRTVGAGFSSLARNSPATLEGLALLSSNADVFTSKVRSELLRKSGEYETIGPAIEHLRDRLKR